MFELRNLVWITRCLEGPKNIVRCIYKEFESWSFDFTFTGALTLLLLLFMYSSFYKKLAMIYILLYAPKFWMDDASKSISGVKLTPKLRAYAGKISSQMTSGSMQIFWQTLGTQHLLKLFTGWSQIENRIFFLCCISWRHKRVLCIFHIHSHIQHILGSTPSPWLF